MNKVIAKGKQVLQVLAAQGFNRPTIYRASKRLPNGEVVRVTLANESLVVAKKVTGDDGKRSWVTVKKVGIKMIKVDVEKGKIVGLFDKETLA